MRARGFSDCVRRLGPLSHYLAALFLKEDNQIDRLCIYVVKKLELTGGFHDDSDAAWTQSLVVHLFNRSRRARRVIILDECVAALEREVLDRAELFELVLKVILHHLALESSDVDLCSTVTSTCHFYSYF